MTVDLLTAVEAEEELGRKMFYRQRIYRLRLAGRIDAYEFKGQTCFIGAQILDVVLNDLELKLKTIHPKLAKEDIAVVYNPERHVIIIDGIYGSSGVYDTHEYSEEQIIESIGELLENTPNTIQTRPPVGAKFVNEPHDPIGSYMPTKIEWLRLDVKEMHGVEVRSMVLVNLSTVADFVGVRSNNLTQWVKGTTFGGHILSMHHKQIQGAANEAPWKKGVVDGYSPYIPFELLPELVVAFNNNGHFKVRYPAKASLLYEISSEALKAVGLAVAGQKDAAAEALASVGQGLGLDVADQIIGVMKTYQSRDFQVKTHRDFSSKVKELGQNYATVTGELTLGITGKNAYDWKRIGKQQGLKSKERSSAREVMRTIAPADGVGMAFGEKHYTVAPSMKEAVKTGKQGKSFYDRLKNVGLLDDTNDVDSIEEKN